MLEKIKKNNIKKFMTALFMLAMLFAPVLFGVNILTNKIEANSMTVNDLKKQIKNQEAKIAQNANKRKELEKKIANAKSEQKVNLQLKQQYDDLIKVIEDEMTAIEVTIGLNEQLMKQTSGEIEHKEIEYENNFKIFLELLRFTYENGNAGYLELFLKADNLSTLLTQIDKMTEMANYTRDVLTNLQNEKNDIILMNETYDIKRASNEEYKNELEKNVSRLKKEEKEIDNYIKSLKKEIEDAEATQAQIERDTKAVQNDIANKLAEIAKKSAASSVYVGGTMLWPVDREYNRITSPFGYRVSPITNKQEHHNGIDISSPGIGGANIYAANDGTVIIAQYNSSYGNYIVIDHGGGQTTLYAHAKALAKKKGDKVKRGDVIAYVGTTGWSTGNHLHFEVGKNGTPQNPLNYVKKP